MEFNIQREKFLHILQMFQGIVEKKHTMPILSNILLDATKNHIKILATDLDVGIRGIFDAEVLKTGKATINARKLYELVRELPEDIINIKGEKNYWVNIACKKARFRISGISPDEFPTIPEFDNDKSISIKGNILKEMIEMTIFAVSTDETRYNLNGIFTENIKIDSKNILRMVATDGHRMSYVDREFQGQELNELKKGVILPRKGVSELRRIIDDEEEVRIQIKENNAFVKAKEIVLTMRIIEGEFPEYRQVIPKDNNIKLIINKLDFSSSLKRISVLSNERTKAIKMRLEGNTITISTNNPDIGEAKEELEVESTGGEVDIGFNARYFIEVLNQIKGEKINLELKDESSQCLMKEKDSDTYINIIMPMRV